jgi:WhiB family transcriptional regulator, redox-sensing transcriptional regulator
MNTLENALAQAIHLVDRIDRPDYHPKEREDIVTSTVDLLDATSVGSAADVFADLGSDGSAPIWASLPDLPCRVEDADLWFAEKPAELDQAKAFCRTCPVRLTCLAGAIARREPWGVWGGEIFERGVVVARKRPRGRPRKNDHGVAA